MFQGKIFLSGIASLHLSPGLVLENGVYWKVMENPYGHDRWCNLMTAHSVEEGDDGGWSGRMGDGV